MAGVLVSGATGQVGNAIVRAALRAGHSVRAMARNLGGAQAVLPHEIEIIEGDLLDGASLAAACEGRDLVFNAAGLPQQWLADEAAFERVNAIGAAGLADAARAAGVRRLIHTSTIDVFAADWGKRFDESQVALLPKPTPYEQSKQRGEELVLERSDGVEVVIVNPAGIYGSPRHGNASLQRGLIEPLSRGRLPALPPGGLPIAFVQGVAEGHLLAADRGRAGERYILSDGYFTVRELAKEISRLTNRRFVPPSIPVPIARTMVGMGEGFARLSHRAPPLSQGQLGVFLWGGIPTTEKAQSELGWEPTPLRDGLEGALAQAWTDKP